MKKIQFEIKLVWIKWRSFLPQNYPQFSFSHHTLCIQSVKLSLKTGRLSNGRNLTSFLRLRDGNNSLPGKGLGKVTWYHVINKSHCSPFAE